MASKHIEFTNGFIAYERFQFHWNLRSWTIGFGIDKTSEYITFLSFLCFMVTIEKI